MAERLDHLEIVAGVCQEIGLACWLDVYESGNRQPASVGSEMWDCCALPVRPLRLCRVGEVWRRCSAMSVLDGRQIGGCARSHHALCRSGQPHPPHPGDQSRAAGCRNSLVGGAWRHYSCGGVAEPVVIALTSGYSRDHRADLKLWMGALSPTPDRDVPLFLQPLAGNGRATVSLLAAVMALQKPLREADGEACVSVAENGISGEATMRRWNRDGVTQVSQVSETMTEVHTLLPQEEQVNDAPIWLLEEDPEEEMVECNTRLPG